MTDIAPGLGPIVSNGLNGLNGPEGPNGPDDAPMREAGDPAGLPGGVDARAVRADGEPRLDEPGPVAREAAVAPQGLPEAVREASSRETACAVAAMALERALQQAAGSSLVLGDRSEFRRMLELVEGSPARSPELEAIISQARIELEMPGSPALPGDPPSSDDIVRIGLDERALEAFAYLRDPSTAPDLSGSSVEALRSGMERLAAELRTLTAGAPLGDASSGADLPAETRATLEEVESVVVAAKALELLRMMNEINARGLAERITEGVSASLKATDPVEALRALDGAGAEIRALRSRCAAAAVLRNPLSSVPDRAVARSAILGGPVLSEDALRTLEKDFAGAASEAMRALLPDEVRFCVPSDALGRLALSAIGTEVSCDTLARALGRGLMSNTGTPPVSEAGLPALRADLAGLLASCTTPAGSETPAARAETLAAVDFVFSQGYPELSEDALTVKMALVPGHARDARLQHAVTMAHRPLMRAIMEGTPSHFSGRRNAVEGTFGSNSMRTFLLTPQTVKSIIGSAGKTDPDAVCYQVANLVVLEREAVRAGLIPLSPEEAQKFMDAGDWCRELGLPQWAGEHAAALAGTIEGDDPEAGDDAFRRLTGAAALHGRGLAGTQALGKGLVSAGRHATAVSGAQADLLSSSAPGWNEAVLLDRLVADLTGLVKAEDRLANPEAGLTLRNDVVNANMRARTELLLSRLGSERKALAALAAENRAHRAGLNAAGGRMRREADVLTRLAKAEHMVVELNETIRTFGERRERLGAAQKGIRFAWPGRQRAERRETARAVLDFCAAHDRLLALPDGAAPEARAAIEQALEACRGRLRGVDSLKMRPAGSARQQGLPPPDDLILGAMRSRAEALRYFDREVSGAKESQADQDARMVAGCAVLLKEHAGTYARLLGKLEKAVGKSFLRDLDETVAAAMLKVACESPLGGGAVSFRNREVKERLGTQLEAWGVPVGDPALKVILNRAANRMLLPDGTIDGAAVRNMLDDLGRLKGELGRAGGKGLRAEFRSEGLGLHESGRAVRRELDARQARLGEGAARVMDLADRPGGGFTWSRTRGVVVDTGAVFMPWSKAEDPFMSNVTSPVAVQFKYMQDDSLSVRSLGPKGFQVVLKGVNSGRGGVSGSFRIPGLPMMKGKLAAGIGGSSGEGIVLDFPDRAACTRFLECAMKRDEGKGPDEHFMEKLNRAMLGARQIRFVNERGVTGDLSANLILTALKTPTVTAGTVSATGSLGFTLGASIRGGFTESVQTNARGSIVTLGWNSSAGLTAAEAVNVGGQESLSGIKLQGTPDVTKNVATLLGATESRVMKLVTDETGVSAQSAYTVSLNLRAGVLKGRSLVNHFRLGDEVKALRKRNPDFAARLGELLDGLGRNGKGDRVSVVHGLRAQALEDIRSEMIAARAAADAGSGRAQEHLGRIHAILNDRGSWRPTKIIVTGSSAPAVLDASRGFGFLQFVRKSSLATTGGTPSVEIDLEAPENR